MVFPPHEPRFARELPRNPPLPFRRREGSGRGAVFAWRTSSGAWTLLSALLRLQPSHAAPLGLGNGEAVGRQQRLEEKKGKPPNSFEAPSKPLVTSRLHHARNTPAAGRALAGSAGAARMGPGRGAGVQKLAQAGGEQRDSPGGPGAAGRRKRRQRSRPQGLNRRGTAFQTQASRVIPCM